jgi:hypothetical protein
VRENDRNHHQHADEERALVRDACIELERAIDRYIAQR